MNEDSSELLAVYCDWSSDFNHPSLIIAVYKRTFYVWMHAILRNLVSILRVEFIQRFSYFKQPPRTAQHEDHP